MPIKTTGAEWKAFILDAEGFWPDDARYEDEAATINGMEVESGEIDTYTMPDDAEVRVIGGDVIWNGGDGRQSLESFFRAWRKAQSTARFAAECPKGKLDAVKAAIVAAGGKVTP